MRVADKVRCWLLAIAACAAPHPAGTPPAPVIPRDVSNIDGIAISPDGAYVGLVEWRYTQPTIVTVWDTHAQRVAFTTQGDVVAFGATPSGEMLAVVFGDPTGMRAMVAATGETRWSGEMRYRPEVAIDRRGTFTTIDRPMTPPVQWDLATGKRLRELAVEAGTVDAAADGSALVTGTLIAPGTVIELATMQRAGLATQTTASEIRGRTIAPDGRTIALTTKQGTLELFGRDGKPRATIPHGGTQARWLDDGTLIATVGIHVTRWTAAGQPVGAFDLPADMHPIGEDLAIGAGGHAVVRRGSELVVLQLATREPTVIAHLGLASRVTKLAWSGDGTRLGIATGHEVATWSAAGGLVPSATVESTAESVEVGPDDVGGPPPGWRLAVQRDRVFERGDAGHVLRFVEAPEELREATRVGDLLVAAGASGTIYAWNAASGAGLGTLAAGAPISALALNPARRTLAVGRQTGGIELWDVGSRTRLATLVVADSSWVLVAASGELEGDPRLLAWPAGDVMMRGDASHAVQRGLSARVLAVRPAPVAIAPTPPVAVTPRGCLPRELAPFARPLWAELAGTTLSYCLGDDDAPYCYAIDLSTRAVTPIGAPVAVLAPRAETAPPPVATVERSGAGVQACARPGSCAVLPASEGSDLAISDDGALVAVGDRRRIETWDVALGKRIARFAVPAWRGKREGELRPIFLGHTVLAITNPCAGPCGTGVMYAATGQRLGPFPLEASEPTMVRFHDDLWIATHAERGGFALIDSTTGAVLQRSEATDVIVARSADRAVAVLGGDQLGKVLAFGRTGRLEAALDTPRCPPVR